MLSKHFLIIFLLIGSTAFAQKGMITGKVIDAKTGLPLDGSSIFLIEKSTTAMADQNGVFHFYKLQAGNYTLKCRYIGYVEKIITDIKKEKENLRPLAEEPPPSEEPEEDLGTHWVE